MKLYSYWRSSSAYRVRIALNIKGVSHDLHAVHLVKDGGQQHAADYKTINPQELVPALELGDGIVLTQSLAIIDWLEQTHPEPAILPSDPLLRARVLAAAHVIAMETQPVTNLATGQQLKQRFGATQDDVVTWMCDYMMRAFDVLEPMIDGTPFAFGDRPSLADICIVPQLYNAHRWGVDLSPYPKLKALEDACLALPAFDAARPENQPDAEG